MVQVRLPHVSHSQQSEPTVENNFQLLHPTKVTKSTIVSFIRFCAPYFAIFACGLDAAKSNLSIVHVLGHGNRLFVNLVLHFSLPCCPLDETFGVG